MIKCEGFYLQFNFWSDLLKHFVSLPASKWVYSSRHLANTCLRYCRKCWVPLWYFRHICLKSFYFLTEACCIALWLVCSEPCCGVVSLIVWPSGNKQDGRDSPTHISFLQFYSGSLKLFHVFWLLYQPGSSVREILSSCQLESHFPLDQEALAALNIPSFCFTVLLAQSWVGERHWREVHLPFGWNSPRSKAIWHVKCILMWQSGK